MRARLTGGSPESPLLIYVGRLGTQKRLTLTLTLTLSLTLTLTLTLTLILP